MARVLDALKPLTGLLRQAADPVRAAYELANAAAAGASETALVAQLSTQITDPGLARPVLAHAGVLDHTGSVTAEAAVRLAQAAVLMEAATSADRWDLVLTVPGFLRTAIDGLVSQNGDAARPRETRQALLEVAAAARQRLLIGAPFLHEDFVRLLEPDTERVVGSGGDVVLVTRALSLDAPRRSDANVVAVRRLRVAAERAGGKLTVRSWEESGLGVHFKVVAAYGSAAYLGSANPTVAGMAGHAEAGVLLRGPSLAGLERWLDSVCDELASRKLPHG